MLRAEGPRHKTTPDLEPTNGEQHSALRERPTEQSKEFAPSVDTHQSLRQRLSRAAPARTLPLEPSTMLGIASGKTSKLIRIHAIILRRPLAYQNLVDRFFVSVSCSCPAAGQLHTSGCDTRKVYPRSITPLNANRVSMFAESMPGSAKSLAAPAQWTLA